MALSSKNSLNLVLAVFSLLVVAGSAVFLTSNQAVRLFSSAAKQATLTGVLFKRDIFGTLKCTYGVPVKEIVVQFPANNNLRSVNFGVLTSSYTCQMVVANASTADPLVGQKVTFTGAYQSNVFYATQVTKAQ